MDWPAARVQKVQRVLPASSGRVQRVLYRLTAMKFYVQRYGTYFPPNTVILSVAKNLGTRHM